MSINHRNAQSSGSQDSNTAENDEKFFELFADIQVKWQEFNASRRRAGFPPISLRTLNLATKLTREGSPDLRPGDQMTQKSIYETCERNGISPPNQIYCKRFILINQTYRALRDQKRIRPRLPRCLGNPEIISPSDFKALCNEIRIRDEGRLFARYAVSTKGDSNMTLKRTIKQPQARFLIAFERKLGRPKSSPRTSNGIKHNPRRKN